MTTVKTIMAAVDAYRLATTQERACAAKDYLESYLDEWITTMNDKFAECEKLREQNMLLKEDYPKALDAIAKYKTLREAAQAVVDRSERHYGYPPSLYVEAIESLKEALK